MIYFEMGFLTILHVCLITKMMNRMTTEEFASIDYDAIEVMGRLSRVTTEAFKRLEALSPEQAHALEPELRKALADCKALLSQYTHKSGICQSGQNVGCASTLVDMLSKNSVELELLDDQSFNKDQDLTAEVSPLTLWLDAFAQNYADSEELEALTKSLYEAIVPWSAEVPLGAMPAKMGEILVQAKLAVRPDEKLSTCEVMEAFKVTRAYTELLKHDDFKAPEVNCKGSFEDVLEAFATHLPDLTYYQICDSNGVYVGFLVPNTEAELFVAMSKELRFDVVNLLGEHC